MTGSIQTVIMERCNVKDHSFAGIYYPGSVSPEKAVIAAGGASCDEKTSVSMCRFLRKAGYNVLVLGFYMWEGLPKELVSIPVDYVENAVNWLRTEKNIRHIAMTSVSTGAGYTLLAASLIPEISCVIPVVPYDHVMEGTTNRFKRLGRSVYTWHGKDIPYAPWALLDQGLLRIFRGAVKDKKYGLKRFMRYGYDHNPVTEESRIRVENMHADVLFLAAKNDDAWPSDEAVPRMVGVLKECGYPYRVESHIYEHASHALTDGLDEMTGYAKWALNHMLPAEKKYPEECEEARQDSFQRILRFLDDWATGDDHG
ncbi:MAG: hypothetical protein K6B72_12675 [Lachnospiraceae bacterium]|nr:hypothetical protein [Lachnospiraceae bacterium]